MPRPRWRSLSSASVAEIVGDLELERSDVIFHYAVDFHEVNDFCFPMGKDYVSSDDLNHVADDQIALWELFKEGSLRTVLLPEYFEELENHLRYLERNLQTASRSVDVLIRRGTAALAATLPASPVSTSDVDAAYDAKLLRSLQQDFKLILAVAMGIVSLGVDRLNEIFPILRRNVAAGVEELLPIRAQLDTYRESPLVAEIYVVIKKDIDDEIEFRKKWRLSERTTLSPRNLRELEYIRRSRERAGMIDARAVDHILQINALLEDAFRRGEVRHHHVLLYVSSAERTGLIFDLDEVQQRLPRSGTERFTIWRTRTQLLTSVIHRRATLDESIASLKGLQQVLLDLEKASTVATDDCQKCVLDGGRDPSCRWLSLCENIRSLEDSIQHHRTRIQNLGLVAVAERYRDLARKAPTKSEFAPYLEQLRTVVESAHIRHLALEWMQARQSVMEAQSRLAQVIQRTPNSDHQIFAAEETEAVTAAIQQLPVQPRITVGGWDEVLEGIIRYYESRPRGAQWASLNEAYTLFVKRDRATETTDPEHELVRCFLYMSFPGSEGSEQAREWAKEMARAHPRLACEFGYILCWAQRRLRSFVEADAVATSMITAYPHDARFYHGRALNTLAWLMDKDEKDHCPRTWHGAVADASTAAELYGRYPSKRASQLIAANWNNVAYFMCLESSQNSSAARSALLKLRALVPKETWFPDYPEYLHTEAMVEYCEYLSGLKQGADVGDLRLKLQYALRDIQLAAKVSKKDLYPILQAEIEKAIEKLPSPTGGAV